MDVVLIRHAAAIDETLALRDPLRMLTARGRADARVLGEQLRGELPTPTHVWTSPLVRAVQTAELVVGGMQIEVAVDVLPALTTGGSIADAAAAVNALPPTACVLLVGHEPGLSELGARLLHKDEIPSLGKPEALVIRDGVERYRKSARSA